MASRYFNESNDAQSTEKDRDATTSHEGDIYREKKKDPFAGPAPVSKEKIESYKRGTQNSMKNVANPKLKGKLKSHEKKYRHANNQAARFELVLTEEPGYLEPDDDERTFCIDQKEIQEHVDVASSMKHFELNLAQFGPYRISYTRNGRFLLLGGSMGHVAAVNWNTKKLICEMNVMEKVNDIKWLHTENMFAVAQRRWVYVYDNQGIELHCLKNMNEALRLDYLPYHFLLVASSRNGFLHYLDVSIGKKINCFSTKGGRLSVLTHNPRNAVVMLGHHNGTVTMWSPTMREPLVKMLCHKNAVRGIAVDNSGLYMATSGQDGKMKIFDIRMFRPIHAYRMMSGPSHLKFSQRGLLAATCNNIVEVYKDPCRQFQDEPFLVHRLRHPANHIQFCPYEDVLGVGRQDGFESLLVPGAGEANYDTLECNPYRSKSQRREWEVKALMEKIHPDMISLDPFKIVSVDHASAERLRKDKETRMGFKKEEPKFEPKYKKKGRSSAGNVQKRKQVYRNSEVREKIKQDVELKRKLLDEDVDAGLSSNTDKSILVDVPKIANKSALNRFKKR